MKGILIIILCFFYQYTIAQYNYSIEWDFNGSRPVTSIGKVTLNLADGTQLVVIDLDILDVQPIPTSEEIISLKGSKVVNLNSEIINVEILAAHVQTDFPNTTCTFNQTFTFDTQSCTNNWSFPGCNADAIFKKLNIFSANILPPNSLESTITCGEFQIPILLECLNGLKIDKWFYLLPGETNFSYLPNHDGQNPLITNTSEFSPNLVNFPNQNIQFKATFINEASLEEVRTVTFISCSPQIKLPFNSTDTKCSYSKDGGFNMNLDRDLNENEELVVGLFAEDKTNPGVYSILVGQNNTETLTDNGDDSYNYQWPDPIEAGNYKVKYQTHPKGENNEPWASLEFSPEFPVGSPPPLFFNAETANDVYCKGGSDGAIKVDAYGGVGKYRYLLNSTTDTIPFTNTNKGTVNARINHTIKNLPKGTKKIKVQDGNGCTEKN